MSRRSLLIFRSVCQRSSLFSICLERGVLLHKLSLCGRGINFRQHILFSATICAGLHGTNYCLQFLHEVRYVRDLLLVLTILGKNIICVFHVTCLKMHNSYRNRFFAGTRYHGSDPPRKPGKSVPHDN